MTFQTYNYNGNITTVDVVSLVNVIGSYFNGDTNNGVNSTLILPVGSLIIDGINIIEGMSVLLATQINSNENGIYICVQTGTSFLPAILKRRNDFQCIEQIKAGQYLTIGKGNNNKGLLFTIIDPIPTRLGIDSLIIINQTTNVNFISSVPNPAFLNGGSSYTFTSTYTQEVPINGLNEKEGPILGELNLNGLINNNPGYAGSITGNLKLESGTYQTGVLAGILSNLDLRGTTPTTINGANIYGLLTRFETYPNNPTDLSNLIGLGLINLNGVQPIGTFIKCFGFASKFAEFDTATTSYFITAGSASGSAGDPARCNADNVLVCSFDDNPCYIPLFTSNS